MKSYYVPLKLSHCLVYPRRRPEIYFSRSSMSSRSFFSSLLLVPFVGAASQQLSVCHQVPQNPAAGQIAAQYLHIPGCGDSSSGGSNYKLANGTQSDSNNTSESTSTAALVDPANPQQPSTNATISASGGGKCPVGFRNTVFNTGAPRNAGWPETTWSSLTENGVNGWSESQLFTYRLSSEHHLTVSSELVGFALGYLNTTTTYDTGSGAAAVTTSLDNTQIHQVMDPTEVSAALTLLKTNPPPYLTLFNEPDYSYGGVTPLTSATDAANDLQPLFAASHPDTTYLSPALADANSGWLTTFRDSCDGCMSQIPIITMHLYNQDPTAALSLIKQLHQTWPDKRIWITELAPGTGNGCSLDTEGIISWLNTLIPQIVELGYVDRIFWNCGESSSASTCKTDLTNNDGSPTAILKAYSAIC